MRAHPIELIAGMDDGIDLDQKDEVTRHIAACDACRTVARAMQRVDRLIAIPEPALPLPKRAAPRQGVRSAGWASIVAVVLTLVVVTSMLVTSFRQAQVSTAAADTCGVLSAAARSADVVAVSAKASAIELPSPLSGSWTACGYGGIGTQGGPWFLFRSVPTAGWEVRGLLMALTSADPVTHLGFGKFIPCSGDSLTERWISEEGLSCGSGTGQAIAVVAEPYFFVVTTPSPGATKRLADAIVAELQRRPWPPLADASKIDACNVITRAAPSAGLSVPDSNRFPGRRHWAEVGPPPDPPTTSWIWNNACAFHGEGGWDQHLWIRDEPTTLPQVANLLPLVSGSLAPSTVDDWVQIEAGMWLAHAHNRDCPGCVLPDYSAVAVLDGPQFFVLTEATDEAAVRVARAMLAEVKRP